jgi:AcrR family transcriptional regulator
VALLSALEEQLQTRPLADVSVGAIAEAAGLGRSAFYFYFPTKEAAVAELLGELFDEMLGGAGDFLGQVGEPPEAVRRGLARVLEAWGEHRLLMRAMLDARDRDPAVRELWDRWLDRFVEPVAAIVAAQRAGVPGPDAADLVRALIAMNERLLERYVRGPEDATVAAALCDTLVHVWQSAIYTGVTA